MPSAPHRINPCLAFVLFLVFAAGCATATVPSPPSTSWADEAASELAIELADDSIEIVPSPYWHQDELIAVAEAVDALPDFLRPTPTRPLRLARAKRTCLQGMGRYNDTCPTFAEDGTFFLYDPILIEDGGRSSALTMLEPQDRLRLLRMRAVAHALFARADENFQWSESFDWRQINGWNQDGDRPQNRHPAGFLRALGRHSARQDLITSAEVFFFRVEDIALTQSPQPERFDPDLSFTCQEFTRQRILEDFFDDVDPSWRNGTWRAKDRPRPPCDAFNLWADLDQISGVDILFAAERTDRPESLFGHLLIHVRHESSTRLRSEGFEYVYQFGAVTDADIDPISYLLEGFTGGFLSIFDLSTFRGIDHTYLQLEQRTLRRYALAINEEQTEHLMQRLWEVERRFAYPYYFSTKNCASMLLDLLDPVIGDGQPLPRRFIAMPVGILDTLGRLEAADGQPLLRKRSDDVLSSEQRAIIAAESRRDLTNRHPSDTELHRLIDALDSAAPAERAQIYPDLERHLLKLLLDQRSMTPSDILLLAESFVEAERANLEQARADLIAMQQRALLDNIDLSEEELFAHRNELFAHEDLQRRARQRNQFSQTRYELFRYGKRRPPSAREQRARQWSEDLTAAFHAATHVQGALIDALNASLTSFDPVEHQRQLQQRLQQRQRLLNDRSLRPSNAGRTRLGLEAPALGPTGLANSFSPQLSLRLAILDDHMGQRRLNGHRPEVEAVGLAMHLRAPLSNEILHNIDAQITLLRYISLATPRGGRGRTLVDSFGWGGELEARLRHHDLPISARAFFGLFYPILRNNSGVDHLAIGMGPLLASDMTPSAHYLSGGVQAILMARKHLAGALANVLFLRLRHFEAVELSGAVSHRQTHLSAGLEVFLPLGHHGLLLSPYLSGELHQYAPGPAVDDRRLHLGFRFEPMRNSLPR